MCKGLEVHAGQFRLRVAGDRAEGFVDLEEAALEILERHADGCVLERALESLVAFALCSFNACVLIEDLPDLFTALVKLTVRLVERIRSNTILLQDQGVGR